MSEDRKTSLKDFLVADDKDYIRGIIIRMLKRAGSQSVQEASSGVGALEILEKAKGKIDCVFCDWDMDPLNGLQVLSLIRRGAVRGVPRDLRILMLTGHADQALVRMAAALDVDGYLVKPVSYGNLVDAIEKAAARPIKLKPVPVYAAVKVPPVSRGLLAWFDETRS